MNRIQKATHANAAAAVSAQEREARDQVSRLYGLSKDEIKIVKEAGSL